MVLVSTAAYFATDALFKSLHGLDNAEFVREFSRIMRKKGSPDTPKGSASILFKNWKKILMSTCMLKVQFLCIGYIT